MPEEVQRRPNVGVHVDVHGCVHQEEWVLGRRGNSEVASGLCCFVSKKVSGVLGYYSKHEGRWEEQVRLGVDVSFWRSLL
jgi:hypothetical protein